MKYSSSELSPTPTPVSRALTPADAEDRVVIALDFGTTYSGIAYAFSNPGRKTEVVPIVDWPGLEGHRQPKVPTLVGYDPKDPTKFKWGGQVDWRNDAVHGVKLLLDPSQPRPMYLPTSNVKTELKKLPKDPVDVAADFMGAIYSHALSKIESASIKDYFHMCQKQFVLSVPAVWSDVAKDKTLRAAKKAGIHPVTLIKEPEAAALYTLHMHERALNKGDAFVVCDAGGGTVDLISYEITSTNPSLELAELVPGKGGMAGSLGLNKRFAEAVQNLVGDEQWVTLKKGVGWSKASTEFDKVVKTAFRGDVDENFYISFPSANLEDDEDEDLVGNCWTMSGRQVKGIFDPLITDIIRLVEEQVNSAQAKLQGRPIKAIFLVGGFGASLYLKSCIENEIPNIQVIQPDGAWAAIVKGAVLSRMKNCPTVTSTQAVRHYGTAAWTPYVTMRDKGQPQKLCPLEGINRVRMNTWYINMGEDLKRNRTIKFPFYRTVTVPYSPHELIFQDRLITSEAKVPPPYPGPDTKVNCTVTADFSHVKKARFKRKRGVNGIEYTEIHYNLVLSTDAANMKFSVEFNGKNLGSADASYE
ncbi:actin-like ATPase domain-containing protein [Xylaria bambusicola]|uniref:actin-like ATPase domain-containing protein n=1 Tax=Xylaria bambusicola TaxID=326684 RepID=UPI0020073C95|nr:actin-like ATPase domain-containing protein [Xylaria bambusicola]KAI0528130.1 actin-like ATPase domain-containing protein [Xylaria bambusicola]